MNPKFYTKKLGDSNGIQDKEYSEKPVWELASKMPHNKSINLK